jgi:gliding motility-associated-like protein
MSLKSGYQKILFFFFALLSITGLSAQSYYSLEFIENKGQWGDQFQFKSDVGSGAFYIRPGGYSVLQNHPEDYQRVLAQLHGGHAHDNESTLTGNNTKKIIHPPVEKDEEITMRSHHYMVKFLGSAENVEPVVEQLLSSSSNYFLGKDRSRWKSGVHSYKVISYKNIYPGVDVRYYSEGGQLKYDLMLAPGADAGRIIMKYTGADKLSVKNGQLIIKTSVGEAKELAPYSYQILGGKKTTVDCQFEISGDQVKFRLKNYDRSAKLVIDPTLIFSTFTGSTVGNWGFTATPGPDGSLFAGGIVFGQGYPITTGAYQQTFGGGSGNSAVDIGITRFSPSGNSRIYSTYIGGNNADFPHSLISDANGNLVVLGRTSSDDYPVTSAGFGPLGGTDIIVTKLNAAGTDLIGSVKIGGTGIDGANIDASVSPSCNSLLYNYGDNARSEVIIDGAGNIYIAASTQSGNFPVVGGVQAALGGRQDAVVVKLTPDLSNVLFSTFLGGNENDAGFVLALNPVNGNIYVAGGTSSNNFPGNKTGSIQPAFQGAAGDIDGYITVLNNNGSAIIQTTYLGTSSIDIIYGIQFDRSGFPYVMGISLGAWPVLNATYVDNGAKQFIAKLQPNLSAYVYSTTYGTGGPIPNISPVAFLVDRCENVYVSGWGGRLNPCSTASCFDTKTSGTAGMRVTPDAIKTTTDNRDFYFFVMEKNATRQLYGSFFGQSGGEGDHVDGGTSRFDASGAIYSAICANCGGNRACASSPITIPFPITPGVVAPVNGALNTGSGGECNLAAFKLLFDYDGVRAGARSSINGVPNDTSGCLPLRVDFTDTLSIGQTYEWDFGDGSPRVSTPTPDVSHNYTFAGNFRVMLIAIDPNKCITRDTSYINIRARDDRAVLDLSALKLPPCESLSYSFDNLASAPASKPFPPGAFTWDFGDNTPRVVAGVETITHTYASQGTYNVKLILTDTSYCNSPDSITRVIRLAPNVQADFDTPEGGCAPYTAVFSNTSLAGAEFIWDFGNGVTFIGATPPPVIYTTPGTYTVKLIANDPATCNLTDTFTSTITVRTVPSAAFTFAPNPGLENTPTTFNNQSSNADRFAWDFGDGGTSTQRNPVHQFNSSGTFNTCLIAFNSLGCSDTVCQPISARVIPLLDIPNAFTPNGDGVNDQVLVRGFGIVKMNFRIYNRWGQLVFQSGDQATGWDGKYKGALQPMDAYAYILDVEFTDGSRTTKKGDITLIR